MIVLALGIPVSPADKCIFPDVDQTTEGDELYPDHYVAAAWSAGIVQAPRSIHRVSPLGSTHRGPRCSPWL
jgi:hypothetical protein